MYDDVDKDVVYEYKGCQYQAPLGFEGPIPASFQEMYIPNAFTPNENGVNDFFKPVTQDPVYIKEFLIMNRWGEIIHRDADVWLDESFQGWDGTYKGMKVPPGQYVYRVTVECAESKVGTVQIL